MGFAAGLDIGSTSTKLVLLLKGQIARQFVIPTGTNMRRAAGKILELGLTEVGVGKKDIDFLVSTGYGRHSIGFGKPVSEITCQAKGVRWLFPEARVIIDIGGQDFKAIKLNEAGHVSNFAMNDKCAAGTGRYLELMANIFSFDLCTFGKSADFSNGGAKIGSVCTVFAETEVINHITKGTDEKEIVAGIFVAVSSRVFSLAKRFVGNAKSLVFTGGVAKNPGMIQAMEYISKCSVQIPPDPQITAALGAAILAEQLAR